MGMEVVFIFATILLEIIHVAVSLDLH